MKTLSSCIFVLQVGLKDIYALVFKLASKLRHQTSVLFQLLVRQSMVLRYQVRVVLRKVVCVEQIGLADCRQYLFVDVLLRQSFDIFVEIKHGNVLC